jgi:uncharacterized repeat protein (TIGR03803 family)
LFAPFLFNAVLSTTGLAALPQITILHNFRFGTSDGSSPQSGVAVLGTRIYGTTLLWGSGSDGILYSVNMDGSGYQILHNFSGADGNQPNSDVTVAGTKVFGTAQFGGTGGGAGNGTIFSYDTSSSAYQNVYQFAGAFNDAATPMAGFTAVNSTLYGITWEGGNKNGGAIYRLNSDGSGYGLVQSLGGLGNPTPGGGPEANMIQVGTKLYGTTTRGGASSQGTIFSYDLNTSAVNYLYSFGGGTVDGAVPHGNLALVGTVLYGIAEQAGSANQGALFSFDTATSNYSVLHNFVGGTGDGASPVGGMVQVGTLLYGTTQSGGTAGDGIIYSLDPVTHDFQIVHNFTGSTSDGAGPASDLTAIGNTLLGTTSNGGTFSAGTLFAIAVPEPSSLMLIGLGALALAVASVRGLI